MTPTLHVLAERQHTALHEPSDQFRTIRARAVDQPRIGASVHLGEWSMSPDDARLLAASLNLLADSIEEN
ncbi:hypothetical protein [Pengzhenrongella frigida]|uniref:Uncharacterized protein n=1 Tax=Pengzhenrongella frigida TaxID=1259133 RepID=A0A4Q5N1W5_9MICO|nr:hypothetical protein [Cellulomonas sp. HLT2-17]RYV52056.1 hypothetical protein EUA98_05685 [Cellulomonas sp. HLT2-17]